MIDFEHAFYLIPLVFLCILIVTGAYKKDYSLTVLTGALFVAALERECTPMHSFYVVVAGVFFLVIRAIINHTPDKWITKHE